MSVFITKKGRLDSHTMDLILSGTQLDNRQDDMKQVHYTEIKDFDEFKSYSMKMKNVYEKRKQLERILALSGETFRIKGYNELINKVVEFHVDYQFCFQEQDGTKLPNWRERLVCSETKLNNRMRGCFQVIKIKNNWNKLLKGNVYITEQVTPFYKYAKKLNKKVIGSEYFGTNVSLGNECSGIRNEDFTQLTFSDSSFDIVITNDVLEHIPDYQKTYHEMHRVLKKDGYAFISVPFDTRSYENTKRAEIDPSGSIHHLLPPEYHGDPVNPEEGILCFQTFGWKMLDELREVGFRDVGAIFYWSFYHGFLGSDQMLFYAKK
jgi:hypothetical protein